MKTKVTKELEFDRAVRTSTGNVVLGDHNPLMVGEERGKWVKLPGTRYGFFVPDWTFEEIFEPVDAPSLSEEAVQLIEFFKDKNIPHVIDDNQILTIDLNCVNNFKIKI